MCRLLAGLAALLSLAGCEGGGNGEAGGSATRSFPLTGFDRVRMSGPDDVEVAIGPTFRIEAAADKETLDALELAVDDGELRVGRVKGAPAGWFGGGRRRAIVRVTLPMLRGVALSGAGNAEVAEASAPVFVGSVGGAGNLRIRRLEARNAAFKLSGAGSMDLAGRAADLTLQVSGAGSVKAGGLEARDLDVTLSGVGSVDARASGHADIRVSGVGSVAVRGTDDCRISKTGVGEVTCAR